MYRIIFILFLCTLVPVRAEAAVRFTEVAWMGIAGASGQFGEWIELYNDGPDAVDLAGWKLFAGSDVLFTLTKSIPAGGYLLVERTTASMTDPVPGVDDEHGSFGSGGLSNEGEDLALRDTFGTTVHSLPYAGGWPAGDAATKETMQWNGSTWITAPGTPKAATAQGGTDDDSGGTTNGGGATAKGKNGEVLKNKTYQPRITLSAPSDLYQYVEYTFAAEVMLEDGLYHTRGPIKWNMGDGTAFTQSRLEPVTHRYRYPGTYTVWIGYYRTVFDTKPQLELSKTVRVGSPAVEVSVLDGEAVEITNHSGATVDLSNWQVLSGGTYAVLPDRTMIAPEASVVFSAGTLGFPSLPNVSLARPTGERLVATSTLPSSVRGATALQPEPLSFDDIFADEMIDESSQSDAPIRNRTKKFIFGAAALTVLALCILLERFMAKREYQAEQGE